MKCRLHYVLITYLCRSKYTPTLAHTHPARHTSHLCREPSNALHTLRRPSGKFLKHMCSSLPHSKLFLLPSASHLSLSLSLFYLAVASWELPALRLRLSLLGAVFLVFSLQLDAFACLLILVYLPSICIRSTSPLPPSTSPFKDKLNQFPIDRVMWCFFSSIFSWTLPQLPA